MIWKDGLLHKVAKLNIFGNTYNFIKDFLSERTIQVKVGDALSETLKLENGTPQGSVISPLLFLIMINDFPTTDNKVTNAIFADDSSIWKSGQDLDKIIKVLQIELDKIQKWSDLWGFILSKEKTVAVIFSRKNIDCNAKLKIRDTILEWKTDVKFLGLIFDSRLTWAAHIKYVSERCNKRLNLMRSLSGTTWGASKDILMVVYKALIRSILDYGCIAYNTASENVKSKLDKIQAQALRICCGAMKCTSIAAMQVECGEMPLKLRRQSLQYKYGVKIKNTIAHPTAEILKQNLKIKKTKTSFAKETAKVLNQMPPVEGPKVGKTPPWHHKTIKPVFELHKKIDKNSTPAVIKQETLALFSRCEGYTRVFTDGSKDSNGVVGASYFIATLGVSRKMRLSDHVSVYTAEMTAIREALRFIQNHKIEQALIISDSLSVLQSLESGVSHSRPNLLEELRESIDEITYKLNGNLIFLWVPAHCGILGNERADQLAKQALNSHKIDKIVNFELKESYSHIDNFIGEWWQREWTTNKKGRALFDIEPNINNQIKYSNKSRDQETTITRMRLGKCCLNSYLHAISVHPTGLCDNCNEQETIEHYIFNCSANTSLTKQLITQCNQLKLQVKISNVLSDRSLTNILYTYITDQKRRI
jgi:ribonuclease HI